MSRRAVMLDQHVVYRHPKDYPDRYVVRRWRVRAGRLVASAEPTAVVSTLAEARAAVPSGLVCVGRQPEDDPVIVEVWL